MSSLPAFVLLACLLGAVSAIPDRWDWREHGAVAPVPESSAACAASYARAAAGCLEAVNVISTNKTLTRLSIQEIIDCSKPEGNRGCQNGNPPNSFKYTIRVHGLASEIEYPFTGREGECKTQIEKRYAPITKFVEIARGDEEAMLQAVYEHGPVAVVVAASSSAFMMYQGGVLDSPACGVALDHVVMIVGYGQTSDGVKYWIVKNWWGPQWGERGYIRIVRGKNMCGICEMASYPLLK